MPAMNLDASRVRLLAAWRQIADEARCFKENSDARFTPDNTATDGLKNGRSTH